MAYNNRQDRALRATHLKLITMGIIVLYAVFGIPQSNGESYHGIIKRARSTVIDPGEGIDIVTPDMVTDARLAYCGTFLIVQFQSIRKLGVVDIGQATFDHFISTQTTDTLFAAGGEVAVIYEPSLRTLSLWHLVQKRRVIEKPVSDDRNIDAIAMGLYNGDRAFVSYIPSSTPSATKANATHSFQQATTRLGQSILVTRTQPEHTHADATGREYGFIDTDALRPSPVDNMPNLVFENPYRTIQLVSDLFLDTLSFGYTTGAPNDIVIAKVNKTNLQIRHWQEADYSRINSTGTTILNGQAGQVHDMNFNVVAELWMSHTLPVHGRDEFMFWEPESRYLQRLNRKQKGAKRRSAFQVRKVGVDGNIAVPLLPINPSRPPHKSPLRWTQILASGALDRIVAIDNKKRRIRIFKLGLHAADGNRPGNTWSSLIDVADDSIVSLDDVPNGTRYDAKKKQLEWTIPDDYPAGIERIILRLVAADGEERYQTFSIDVLQPAASP